MEVQLVILLAEQRAKQLNATYHLDYKDIVVKKSETITIEAGGDSFFIEAADSYMTITSENGSYDNNSPILNENQHEHNGTISIVNNIDIEQRVKFVVVSYMAKK